MDRKSIQLAAVLILGAGLSGCSAAEEQVGPEPWQPGEVASTEQLRNRINNLTDLQGRALYTVPQAQTQRVIKESDTRAGRGDVTPVQCAAADPPQRPAEIRTAYGRSNLSTEELKMSVWLHSAPGNELTEYLLGREMPAEDCRTYTVDAGARTSTYVITPLEPDTADGSYQASQVAVTDEATGKTVYLLSVTGVNGTLGATVSTRTSVAPEPQSVEDLARVAQLALNN
jgi:hypothetical protein